MTAKPQTEPTLAEMIAEKTRASEVQQISQAESLALRECAEDLTSFHARLTALVSSELEFNGMSQDCAKKLLAQLGVLKP